MNKKITIILIIIVLVGLIYFVESRKNITPAQTENTSEIIPTTDTGNTLNKDTDAEPLGENNDINFRISAGANSDETIESPVK